MAYVVLASNSTLAANDSTGHKTTAIRFQTTIVNMRRTRLRLYPSNTATHSRFNRLHSFASFSPSPFADHLCNLVTVVANWKFPRQPRHREIITKVNFFPIFRSSFVCSLGRWLVVSTQLRAILHTSSIVETFSNTSIQYVFVILKNRQATNLRNVSIPFVQTDVYV